VISFAKNTIPYYAIKKIDMMLMYKTQTQQTKALTTWFASLVLQCNYPACPTFLLRFAWLSKPTQALGVMPSLVRAFASAPANNSIQFKQFIQSHNLQVQTTVHLFGVSSLP